MRVLVLSHAYPATAPDNITGIFVHEQVNRIYSEWSFNLIHANVVLIDDCAGMLIS